MGKKIVVYTSIFGGYEDLLPQQSIEGIDFICFTDRPVKRRPWKCVKVAPEMGDPTRDSRRYKILPHKFLPEYEYSVYIDANYLITGDLRSLVHSTMKEKSMAVFDHNQTASDRRDCVYDELNAILEMGNRTGTYKDDPAIMKKQIQRYRTEGYPEHHGLTFNAVLIRKHNDPAVIRTMERWWTELNKGSKRDQLSFNYSAWKENFSFATIPGNLRNNQWFYMIGIHRKNYRWKYLRYRLKNLLGIKKNR